MTKTLQTLSLFGLLAFTACGELPEEQDRMGNYEVEYADNLRVYINDELVAEVEAGEDATVEWNGETFDISVLCSDEGVNCPSEEWSHSIAVDQPWGTDHDLLNFVNLDPERGVLGGRLGGILEPDGSYSMLAGLGVGANQACVALAVGTVVGSFSEDSQTTEGSVVYEWAGGCKIGAAEIGAALRLESDFVGTRVGDFDISSVEAEAPIDEEGQEIDPDKPELDEATEALGTEESGEEA